jgi:hypothetical protein
MASDGGSPAGGVAAVSGRTVGGTSWRPPEGRHSLQLALATVWLLDGVRQLQRFMFTCGSNGFSAMPTELAAGNPHFIAHAITWKAEHIDHHAGATDTAFPPVLILIGFGIAWRPSLKPTLARSIIWSFGVW